VVGFGFFVQSHCQLLFSLAAVFAGMAVKSYNGRAPRRAPVLRVAWAEWQGTQARAGFARELG
jgi:hypothetical protein